MEEKDKVIAYKGFEKDLTCRGFQYEIGKEYECNGEIEVCNNGFHACANPFDVFDYYGDIFSHRYCEVEQSGKIIKDKEKQASSVIKIKAEIGLDGLLKAGIEWLKNATNPENFRNTDDKLNDNSKHCVRIGSNGGYAQIGSSGEYAQIGSSGGYAQIGSSGDYVHIGSSGDYTKIGSSGYYAQIGCSGNDAQIGSSGEYAQIGSSGDYAQISSTGENCVICCAGHNSAVKAKVGSWITLSEWKYNDKKQWAPYCVKTEYVDGERIKGDTWYKLVNGEFKETDL